MPCVFCGSTGPISREHVWPDWLSGTIPQPEGTRWQMERGVRNMGRKIPSERTVFEVVPFTQTVKRVCRACNETWMSEIENATKPFLTPLLQGRGRHLHRDGKALIATWIMLRVLVLEWLQPRVRFVPDEQFAWMHEHRSQRDRQPPPKTTIWIGAFDDATIAPIYFQQGLHVRRRGEPVGADNHGHAAIFSVGRLAAYVVSFRASVEGTDAVRNVVPDDRVGAVLIRIWPGDESIVWPPPAQFSQSNLLSVANLFEQIPDETSAES